MKKLFFVIFLVNGCGFEGIPDFSKSEYEISDVKGPTVIDVYPAPSSENVPVDCVISVSFSEPVLTESIDELSFYVQSKTERVRGTYIFTENNTIVYFLPEMPLDPLTNYTITLNNRITDPAGNELIDQDINDKLPATPFVSNFTTGEKNPENEESAGFK